MLRLCLPIVLAIPLVISGCVGDESSWEETMYINHHKTEYRDAWENVVAFSYLAKMSESSDWDRFSEIISGFDYEWGYTYKIRVLVKDIGYIPEDTSQYNFTLLEVESKTREPSSTLFEMRMTHPEYLQTDSTGQVEYLGQTIACEQTLCDAVANLKAQDHSMLLELHHPEIEGDPLQMVQIMCSDSSTSFASSCL